MRNLILTAVLFAAITTKAKQPDHWDLLKHGCRGVKMEKWDELLMSSRDWSQLSEKNIFEIQQFATVTYKNYCKNPNDPVARSHYVSEQSRVLMQGPQLKLQGESLSASFDKNLRDLYSSFAKVGVNVLKHPCGERLQLSIKSIQGKLTRIKDEARLVSQSCPTAEEQATAGVRESRFKGRTPAQATHVKGTQASGSGISANSKKKTP